MILVDILIATLGVYGIATIVTEYAGPFEILRKARDNSGGFLECPVCLSPWIAILLCALLGLGVAEYLAVIGASVMLMRNL